MTKVLVVDDSALMRRRIGQILTAHGLTVETARNGLHALDCVERVAPDVITLDINMPEMDGLTCLAELMQRRPTPVVMISSLTEDGAVATLEALSLGAVDYVCKPGGTVSLDIAAAEAEIAAKVTAAAKARLRRATGLRARLASERAKVTPSRAANASSSTGVVVIGSSTGGPSTLEEVLGGLPSDFPAPILVCQHIPASFTGPLARRLDGVCALPVQEVTKPTLLENGHVYIGRGDADFVVGSRGERLVAMPTPSDRTVPWRPSVGRLVRSVMKVVAPQRVIGVMLTGMGDDGAADMALLRRSGAHTVAEAESTCVVFGMPQALIKAGGAETVLPCDDIAAQVARWASALPSQRRA